LGEAEEAACCIFRKLSRFPLDDCFDALQESIPSLSRSNLHRCLQRNGISRLKDLEAPQEREQKGTGKVNYLGARPWVVYWFRKDAKRFNVDPRHLRAGLYS